jgi:hypothetical protein
MLKASELRSEFRAALADALAPMTPGQAVAAEEVLRALDVVINAAVEEARTEAFALSPATKWLSKPGRRLTGTVMGGRATVRLLDVADKRGVMSVEATGETIEQAMANCLNKVFAES